MATSVIHSLQLEAYMVTILNWTPIFGWYMARLPIKNGHRKTCGSMRLNYVLKHRQLRELRGSRLTEKENHLHLNSVSETLN